MSTQRLRNVLQTDRIVFDKTELNCVVTVTACRALCLDDDTRSRFDDSDRRYRSVFREDLRHSDFSTNDSANHTFPFWILDF
jgi:hypothetical protein